jgi:hypothetical protein
MITGRARPMAPTNVLDESRGFHIIRLGNLHESGTLPGIRDNEC